MEVIHPGNRIQKNALGKCDDLLARRTGYDAQDDRPELFASAIYRPIIAVSIAKDLSLERNTSRAGHCYTLDRSISVAGFLIVVAGNHRRDGLETLVLA